MDRTTLQKYNMLKNNNIIYSYIWSITNNNLRNMYINYLCVCLNKNTPYIIDEYHTNSSVGMPRILNVITTHVYFNHYHNRFDIHIFKNNNCYNALSQQTLYNLKSIINPTSKLYNKCVKYYNYTTNLLYLSIFKLSLPQEINCLVLSYLTGESDKISSDTEACTPSGRSGHSRDIRI